MTSREAQHGSQDAATVQTVARGPAPPAGGDLAALAAGGNQAFGRLLAGGGGSGAPTLARQPIEQCRIDDTPEFLTKRWALNNKGTLLDRLIAGTISQPEAVAMARGWDARISSLDPGSTVDLIQGVVGGRIPEHRKKVDAAGMQAELGAGLSNLKLPEVKLEGRAGALTISSGGVEAVANVGGGKAKAEVGPEGAEVSVKDKNKAGVTAKVGWNGKKGEIAIGDDRTTFAFKADKEGEGDEAKWKWSLNFTLRIHGAEVTPQPELTKAVIEGQAAIGKLVQTLRDGLDPETVKGEFDKVKSAVEALSKAAKEKEKKAGVSLSAGVGGTEGGGPPTVSVGIKFQF